MGWSVLTELFPLVREFVAGIGRNSLLLQIQIILTVLRIIVNFFILIKYTVGYLGSVQIIVSLLHSGEYREISLGFSVTVGSYKFCIRTVPAPH